jgi:hypothetical protein
MPTQGNSKIAGELLLEIGLRSQLSECDATSGERGLRTRTRVLCKRLSFTLFVLSKGVANPGSERHGKNARNGNGKVRNALSKLICGSKIMTA